MTTRINARPLSEILSDLSFGGKRITQKLAEEAVAAVAADGVVSKSEVDQLEPYADGSYDYSKQAAEEAPGWKQGTEAGRALLNSLATTVRDLNERANVGQQPSVDFLSLWTGGWMSAGAGGNEVKVDGGALLKQVREHSVGWVHNSVDDLLRCYPKATVEAHTDQRVPKPEVQAAIDALTQKWVAGEVPERAKISDALKPLLDSRYR
jgi:hypothetical protein